MGSVPNDWKHLLRTGTSQKSLLKIFYTTIKSVGKQKTSENFLIKKFIPPFSLIVLNTTNLSNSLHVQTSLRNTIFSVLVSGVRGCRLIRYLILIGYLINSS